MSILNGRVGNDNEKGDFTFIDSVGCSVIDYVIASKSVFETVLNLITKTHKIWMQAFAFKIFRGF